LVDNSGEEIFPDKVGVMLARDISAIHENAQFVNALEACSHLLRVSHSSPQTDKIRE
jgi:hypothetical protein